MAQPAGLEVQQESQGSAVRLTLAGELDLCTATDLSQRLDEIFATDPSELTVDLSDLRFMDSTGLRLLLELNNRSEQGRWRLSLIAPKHEAAVLVLRATGTDTALPFVDPAS